MWYITGNREIKVAREYHENTKHSFASVRFGRHYLNPLNQPSAYKIYPNLEAIPLPSEFPSPHENGLKAVSTYNVEVDKEQSLNLNLLASILYYSAGQTKKLRFPGGAYYFRAAASAGALYPVEIYIVCKDIPELDAGLYHFSPRDFMLRRLRVGDYRGELSRSAGYRQDISGAPVTIVLTSIFWRSAWKYQARSYRYCLWDTGTILSNILATASANKLSHTVITGFIDSVVNHLLGVDGEHEGALCLVPVGSSSATSTSEERTIVPPIAAETIPLSNDQVDYPEIIRMHKESCLTKEEVNSWVRPSSEASQRAAGKGYGLIPIDRSSLSRTSLSEVIRLRGSSRRFAYESISFSHLSCILEHSTRGIPADFPGERGASLNDIYIIVNAVDDLTQGAYLFSSSNKKLELLKSGNFRSMSGYLCLEQALGNDASAVVFFLADLRKILDRYGNRGYRACQIEAGILGGKMYLCAYSLGLGATGLTFYDDDVTDFFSPHASGKSAIFVVALGVPYRSKHSPSGKF